MSTKKFLFSTLIVLAVIILMIWTLFPLYWNIVLSFKSVGELRSWPPSLIPLNPTLENYIYTWTNPQNWRYYSNSVIVTIVSTGLALLLGVPSAYACARFRFKGRSDLLFMILTFRFLPPAAVVIPLYMFGSYLKLIDTHILLICIYAAISIPLVVWVMLSYFQEIPVELEESYMIDGFSRLQAFLKVSLPLVRSGLAAISMLLIALNFGEFLFAAMLTSSTAKTFPVYLAESAESPMALEWGRTASLVVLGLMLLIIIFVYVRKHLARGLTFGAIR